MPKQHREPGAAKSSISDGDRALNNAAVRALFEVNCRINDLVGWVQAGPYLMADEDKAVDVGMQILGRLYEARTLSLKHMRELALAAGIPSPAVTAALEKSLEGAFERPRGR